MVGGSPAIRRPSRSSFASRAGSSRPRRDVGRRDQPAVVEPDADVAGAAEGRGPRSKIDWPNRRSRSRSCRVAHGGHGARSNALVKKSGAPKLPDFSASASAGAPRLTVQGTPGSICGPICSALTPSACDHGARGLAAGDHQAAHAVRDQALGDRRPAPPRSAAPARSRPSRAWTGATSVGRRRQLDRTGPWPRAPGAGQRVRRSRRRQRRAGRGSSANASRPAPWRCDLPQRRGRAAAGEHRGRAVDRGQRVGAGRAASSRPARRKFAGRPEAMPEPPVISGEVGAGGADVDADAVARSRRRSAGGRRRARSSANAPRIASGPRSTTA